MTGVHVVPGGDVVLHERSTRCWCAPITDWSYEPPLVVHHPSDGRLEYRDEAPVNEPCGWAFAPGVVLNPSA